MAATLSSNTGEVCMCMCVCVCVCERERERERDGKRTWKEVIIEEEKQ